MSEGQQSFDGAVVQQQKPCFSGKVCFICRFISRHREDDHFQGYLIFVFDLSELVDGFKGFLQPNILLEYYAGMSVCGLDSTLYFTDSALLSTNKSKEVFSLDIQTQDRQLKLGASDLRSLPPMWGTKRAALITSIPGTKKILVFSSVYYAHCFYPDLVDDGRDFDDDDDDDDEDEEIDFEMYDVETNSWKKLPDLLIRISYAKSSTFPSYFLHESNIDRKGTEIPSNARDENFRGFQISRYTFIDKDTVFLVQLTCRVMLTLDLKSPSKGWKLYNKGMVTKPTSDRNLFVVAEKNQMSWCASDIGGDRKFGNVVPLPLSSFDKDDPVKPHTCSSLTPLEADEGKGHVCIVQGGVSRDSKHPQVIMDVVDVQAKNQAELVASCRFMVMHKCRRFLPFCMFVYHPKVCSDTDISLEDQGSFVEYQVSEAAYLFEINQLISDEDAGFNNEIMEEVDDTVIPEVGMKFCTYEEAFDFYKQYTFKVGFPVRKRNSEKGTDGNLTNATFACSREA